MIKASLAALAEWLHIGAMGNLWAWLGDTWWLLTTDKTDHSELTMALLLRIAIIAAAIMVPIVIWLKLSDWLAKVRKPNV